MPRTNLIDHRSCTGDYWKGLFYRLEAEGFDCVLADAKQVRHLPGRPKKNRCDARWLAASFERGTVTPCFVATPEFRVIRLHTRYRRDLTEDRTREKQRAEKLLESALKLSSVISDPHGLTGRDIMNHLVAGERDPKVLAQLTRACARRKIRELGAGTGGRGVLHASRWRRSPARPPVSCPAAGSCAAVGTYFDGSYRTHVFVVNKP